MSRSKRSREDDVVDKSSTSTVQNLADSDKKYVECLDVLSISDSQIEDSDCESSVWTDSKDVEKLRQKHNCPYCDASFDRRHNLTRHLLTTCVGNPNSKTNKEFGKYKCNCGRNFTYLKGLTYHKKHECNKMVTCPDCGRTMKGAFITDRHKQNHCVKNKRRKTTNTKKESLNELFGEESSIDFTID